MRRTNRMTFALSTEETAALVAGGCGCPGEALAVQEDLATLAALDPTVRGGRWEGPIGVEGKATGDGRYIEPNVLVWENLPVPLRFAPEDNGEHLGAVVTGRILSIERRGDGQIWGSGDFDAGSEEGREAERHVREKLTTGISMDLDSVSFEVRMKADLLSAMAEPLEEGEEPAEPETDEEGRVVVYEGGPEDEVLVITGARIRAATIVAIPAFEEARIEWVGEAEALAPAADEAEPDDLAAGAFPAAPPSWWFENPGLTEPTPLTILADGRVFGHLATWGTCHTGFPGQCVTPPSSPSGYRYFRTGSVVAADGKEIPTGKITLDTLHAKKGLGPTDTLAHYEHTGRAAADVAAGDDAHGIWIAGALRPGVTEEQVRALRASPLSGDWRRIGGSLELVAALAVNVPGFPVPRPQGLVAGGVMTSLVASGMLAPRTGAHAAEVGGAGLSKHDVAYLQRLAQRERRNEAAALASRTRGVRARLLAKRALG